jgi:hypothetical protein
MLGPILIFLLPGSVLALHQGIDHLRGAHVPQLIVFRWKMPFWIFYPTVVLTGPLIMLMIVAQIVSGKITGKQ